MENLVGRQIKGFRFSSNATVNKYIGKIGVVVHQSETRVSVKFDDWHVWQYPLDQIQPHLIPLEVFKIGQKVWDMSIQEEAGIVVSISPDPYISSILRVSVEFQDYACGYSTEGVNKYGKRTLSTTPYTFQGFSQETIIERGTLVYFKDSEKDNWNIGFYDEFKENEHHCFIKQKKEGHSLDWTFCQTENPLI